MVNAACVMERRGSSYKTTDPFNLSHLFYYDIDLKKKKNDIVLMHLKKKEGCVKWI